MKTAHRSIRDALGIALVLTTIPAAASVQSLADLARREAERRTEVAGSGRVYTNADLLQGEPAPAVGVPPPAIAAPATTGSTPSTTSKAADASTPPTEATTEEPLEGREKRDEPYWRARARDLRGRLALAENNATRTEAYLREIDAGPQTPALAREREVVAAALARQQSDLHFRREEVAQFEALARLNKVPADWIR